MQEFTKAIQECIWVERREIESKGSKNNDKHKWASKGDLNTHLGSHTLGQSS